MSGVKSKGSNRSGLFLIELIVAILFFSLASAICIQLFVKAHIISQSSQDLTMALNQAQTAVEAFKSTDGNLEDLKLIIGGENGDAANELLVKYDSGWQPVTSNESTYKLTVSLSEQNPITATVVVAKSDSMENPIYSVETKKYNAFK